MESKSLGSILKAAVIAGIMAGILVSVFHFAVTERVMDNAIEIEAQLHQTQDVTGETILVDRGLQKAGLFLGFIMYGLAWSLLFAVVRHLAQRWLTAKSGFRRDLLIGLLAGWSVALLPFLKYPANPPGVGDPETVQYRQLIFLTFIVLSVANSLLALALHRFLGRPRAITPGKHPKWAIVLAAYGAGAAVLYVAMPTNPDAVQMPADLVWTFRALSFVGLAIFWTGFSGGFAWLLRAGSAARARRSSSLARLRMN
ncbi:MAG: CbtA family protein [Dehalococcoidia bacterium]|nr:CbtA family protein [Dehalococcoidia bacterium]